MLTALFVISLILFIVGFVIWYPTRKGYSHEREDWLMFPAGMILFFVALFWIPGVVLLTSDQIDDQNTLIELEEQRGQLKTYEADVEENIRESLAKYPPLEGKIIKDIDPVILVNYPDLKSSKTITEQFKALQSVDKKLLDNKNKQFRIEKDIRNRDQNPVWWGMVWA